MKIRISATSFRRLSVLGSIAALGAAVFSCSSTDKGNTVGTNPLPGSGMATGQGGSATNGIGGQPAQAGTLNLASAPADNPKGGPCTGLECQVQACSGAPTTISGKIYDPAGKVPLYNVLVYVPNGPVEPFTEGAACDRCGASVVNPVTAAVTDEAGSFVLKDAPVGQNIPIVIQVGKWRRQITVPNVAACADTALNDPNVTRLPRNRTEGDLPRIAITTGSSDQMECLPLRIGVDPSEFTSATGDGRIHLYTGDYQGSDRPGMGGTGGMGGGGGNPLPGGGQLPLMNFDATLNNGAMLTRASTLWNSVDNLKKYDIVIMSCEGNEYANQKPAASRRAVYEYASLGGRVFASHFHHIWFSGGPDPVPSTGTWRTRTNPGAMGGGVPGGMENPGPFTATINQTFPKGAALAKWLVNVGASSMLGQMDLMYPRDNIQAIDPTIATEWLTMDNPNFADAPKSVQYMSFNTPIGATEDKICGREVYTDVHVASVDVDTIQNELGFPASCGQRELTPQEKAVAFMLFDLSACVQSEEKPPKPPE